MVRRPTVPGVHGKKRRRSLSEYGLQLQEKQKLRNTYGLGERQFKTYVQKSLDKKGVSAELLMSALEVRLDNAVFRLGFAKSRSQARQLVVHGFFKVNGRKNDKPSRQMKIGDTISINETKDKKTIIEDIKKEIKKHNVPEWLEFDSTALKGTIKSIPALDKIDFGVDLQRIIEFYSR